MIPLVCEIVQGLLKKGETVRVELHHGINHIEGTLVNLRQVDSYSIVAIDYETLDNRPHGSYTVSFQELEQHSRLRQIDVGWQLTIHVLKEPHETI